MQKHVPYATWFVPRDQKKAYFDAGAVNIVEVNGSLPMKAKQCNAAIDYAADIIVTMDDDFVSASIANDRKSQKYSLMELLKSAKQEFLRSEFKLAGFSSSSNPFFTDPNKPISHHGMITGQCLLHKFDSKIRFDENVKMLEDLEFIINHHVTYGGVLKLNHHLVKFKMNENPGGYQGWRTQEMQQETIDYILSKYNNNAALIFDEDHEVGKNFHKRVKWKQLKNGLSNIDTFL